MSLGVTPGLPVITAKVGQTSGLPHQPAGRRSRWEAGVWALRLTVTAANEYSEASAAMTRYCERCKSDERGRRRLDRREWSSKVVGDGRDERLCQQGHFVSESGLESF